MKAIRKFVTDKELKDMQGMTIPKGTTLHVMKEKTMPKSPMDGNIYKFTVVRVDNGTGHLHLMPETSIKEQVSK